MAKSSNDKVVRRGVYLYIDGNEIKNDIKSIQGECKKLESAVKRMTVGSEEYVQTTRKIQVLKGIIAEHNQTLRQTENQLKANAREAKNNDGMFRKMADGFNNYMGMITAFVASITGVMLTMRKTVNDYLSLDSVYSDVMKYTGMTRDEVIDLNESLKEMDTRTARTELNRLAGEAGKLGIQGKKDLLDFVQAADVINVSLGEDLGEDAIKNIGKLAQMFGDADRMGLKQAMLSIGSVINHLGSTSSAAEGYLTEFIARMAGVGKQAKLDIPTIAAYGAVLDQDMQKLEASSTALQNILMKIYQDPTKFAKLAKMDVQEFAELVKTDINEAFLQLLDNLGKLGDMNVLAPIFKEMKLDGSEATAVLADLAKNVDNIRKQQIAARNAFEEGTSVVNEFNTKNNDLTAGMEKAKKVFQERVYQLGQQLLPYMSKLVTTTSLTVKGLSGLIEVLIKYGDVIMILTTGLVLASAKQKLLTAATVTWNTVCKIGTTLTLAHNMAMTLLNSNTNKVVAATKALTVELAGHNVILNILKATIYLTSSAFMLLTGNITKAKTAFRAFTAILKTNPYVLIIAAITAVGAGLYTWYKRTKEAKTITEEFNASIMQERSELDTLYAQLNRTNISQAERTKLIGEFNEKFGKYMGNLLSEKAGIDEIKKAYGEVITSMNDYYARKLLNEKTSKLFNERAEEESKLLSKPINRIETLTEGQKARIQGYVNQVTNTMLAVGGSIRISDVTDKIYEEIQKNMGSPFDLLGGANDSWKLFAESITPYIRSVAERMSKINQIKNELSPFFKQADETIKDIPEIVVTGNNGKPSGASAGTASGDKDIALDEERRYQQELLSLKELYLNNDNITREEYARLAEDLELKHLENRLKIANLEPEKIQEIKERILDIQIQFKERCLAEDEDEKKELLNSLQKSLQLEIQTLEQQLRKGLITRQAFNQAMLSLIDKYGNEAVSKTNATTEKQKKALQEFLELLNKEVSESTEKTSESTTKMFAAINENWRELSELSSWSLNDFQKGVSSLIQTFHDYSKGTIDDLTKTKDVTEASFMAMAGFAQSFGVALGESLKDDEESLGDFFKNVISMVLDTIEKLMVAYIAETTMKDISKLGFAGLATAAAKIALITAAFETAKAALGGYSGGGYTPAGAWNEPQGIVHSNEFVSNRFAVSNPNLRPVFDLIDYAQRSNTVSNLTGDDVAAVLPARSRPGRPSPSGGTPSADYAAIAVMLGKLAESNERLMRKLDEPITAVATVSGRNGIRKALDDYDKLLKNKSRND